MVFTASKQGSTITQNRPPIVAGRNAGGVDFAFCPLIAFGVPSVFAAVSLTLCR
jgi:hypothetical protein